MKRQLLFVVVLLFSTTIIFAQNLPNYVPKNGLVGWWPFNGNANDESGNGNHGTVNGATLSSDRNGELNRAYYYNGNSFISLMNNFDQNNRTISVWFKNNSQDNFIREILNNDHEGLKYGHTIISFMSIKELSLQSGSFGVRTDKIFADTWNFVLITRDSLNTKYFLNGVLIHEEINYNIKSNNPLSQNLRIGVSRYAKNFFIDRKSVV